MNFVKCFATHFDKIKLKEYFNVIVIAIWHHKLMMFESDSIKCVLKVGHVIFYSKIRMAL